MNIFYILFIFFAGMSVMLFSLSLFLKIKDTSLVWEVSLFQLGSTEMDFILFFDWMGFLFMSVVFLISGAVSSFSEEYMKGDFYKKRFMWMIFAFVLSMSILIFSLNLVSLLLGWDGLGVVSFALILYYNNENAMSASLLTALSNRVGDVAIILAIAFLLKSGSWNFMSFLSKDKFVLFLIILASMTKSAQFPFSAWLPAAMAAPTPVSALVHSSTLVTAGVYLMIRFFPSLSEVDMTLLSCVAILTSIFAGLSACFEYDLKKIIALSTLSQLGFMFFILSMNLPVLAFFHLISHATLKALLFISAGKIIHESGGNQDLRVLSGSIKVLPSTSVFMNLAVLSLGGLPFLTGFYSKDSSLEMILSRDISPGLLISIFLMIVMSSVYSVRMLVVLSTSVSFSYSLLSSIKKESSMLFLSYLLMGAGALSSGSFFSWVIFMNPLENFTPLVLKLLILTSTTLGVVAGVFISKFTFVPKKSVLFLASLSQLPLFSGNLFMKFSKLPKEILSLDQGWFEFLSGESIFNLIKNLIFVNPVNLYYKMFSGLFMSVVALLLIMVF